MSSQQRNEIREWAIRRAREYAWLFGHFAVPRAWWVRWLFVGGNGDISVPGQHVLADLRDFCHVAAPTIFDTDPLIMARREGRREVFVRIQNFLNLDEGQVRQLMEIDDGIE